MEQGPSKELMYIFNVLTSVFSSAAIILNAFLIIVIAKNKSLQQIECMFLANLAVGDILMGLCGFGIIVICNETHQHLSACLSLIAACSYADGDSLFFFAILTVDKYVRILHPFHYTRFCTKRNVVILTIGVHVASIGLVGFTTLLFEGNNDMLCSIYTEFSVNAQLFLLSLISVTLLLVAVANIRILFVAWKKRNEVQDFNGPCPPRSNLRVVKVLAVLVMFMFVFYIPIWTLMILKITYELPQHTQDSFALCATPLWLITPMFDGIAFLFCRQDIRKCAWKLFKC